jgi:hypothetical protein
MADSSGTGADTEVDASNQGVVPPGESKGEGGKPPDGEWIKRSQFVAALNHATAKADTVVAQNAELQRQVNELKAAQAKADAPKEATLAELNRLVATGDITQAQADAVWEKQQKAQTERVVAAKVAEHMTAAQHSQWIESQLQGYRQLVGAAWEAGTPERAKVEAEFQYLTGLGQPSSKATEVAALRAAFGDVESLRTSRTARPGSSETHSETGGGKPAGGGPSGGLKLDERQRQHYTRLIDQGLYKDWSEVEAELKATPKRKAR